MREEEPDLREVVGLDTSFTILTWVTGSLSAFIATINNTSS